MPEFRGNLRDLGAATMAGLNPRVYFTPTRAGVKPSGTIISTEPVAVDPDADGEFTLNLVSTGDLLPRTRIRVTVDWLIGPNTRAPYMDLGLELDVPDVNGTVADMVRTATHPGSGLVWIGVTPPTSDEWEFWLDTSVFPPALKTKGAS